MSVLFCFLNKVVSQPSLPGCGGSFADVVLCQFVYEKHIIARALSSLAKRPNDLMPGWTSTSTCVLFCWVYVFTKKRSVCVFVFRVLFLPWTVTNLCTSCQYEVSHLRPLVACGILDRPRHALSRRRQSLACMHYSSLAATYTRCNGHRIRQMMNQILCTSL